METLGTISTLRGTLRFSMIVLWGLEESFRVLAVIQVGIGVCTWGSN
jgi:hypothetical protein